MRCRWICSARSLSASLSVLPPAAICAKIASRQYGLDFGLWTRSVVAGLIESKFGIRLGLTAVGGLLAKLGLTPQKPLHRAYRRDPEAIEKWQRETFPAIARAAEASGAEVYFWDESGFRAAV